jgi:hypothetical protein
MPTCFPLPHHFRDIVQEIFDGLDNDGDGDLSFKELERGLTKYGVDIGEDTRAPYCHFALPISVPIGISKSKSTHFARRLGGVAGRGRVSLLRDHDTDHALLTDQIVTLVALNQSFFRGR